MPAFFAAAPSVAIGTLGLTILSEGKLFAATEARSTIGDAGRQYLLEREHLLSGIEYELVPAALGSFDDDLDSVLKVFIEWRKPRRVGKNLV